MGFLEDMGGVAGAQQLGSSAAHQITAWESEEFSYYHRVFGFYQQFYKAACDVDVT